MRYAIIGGGIVGLATALELKRFEPDAIIQIIEKEYHVGCHQSTHNSGVLHAGLYYKPGSLKARLAVDGIRRMVDFCEEHRIRHEICGKLVVATSPEEVPRLRTLLERGIQNGLRGVRWLEPAQFKDIEPHAAGIAAVYVPEEGIVDYRAVCDAMQRRLDELGVTITLGAKVTRIQRRTRESVLVTTAGEFTSDFVINCAGLQSDYVVAAAGERRECRIVPFRGEYYKLKQSAQHLVRNLIYPVPDPTFPFLGVHYTRLIEGGIEAGPNAVLAMAREGYTKWKIRPAEFLDAVTYRGLWAFMSQHRAMAWAEVRRSFSRRLFCASLQRLVPELQESDLELGGTGVRAQAMLPNGTLLQDFHFVERAHALHIVNAPSPGATAALAIGSHIVHRVASLAKPTL